MPSTATILSLFAAASLAAAHPNWWPTHASPSYSSNTPTSTPTSASSSTPSSTICPLVQEGDYVWKISEFSARKLNGVDNNAVSFNISATNEGTLNFECGAHTEGDNVLAESTYYSCGTNSFISFAFEGTSLTSTRLLLKQEVSDK
jgi:hypothetical protein